MMPVLKAIKLLRHSFILRALLQSGLCSPARRWGMQARKAVRD